MWRLEASPHEALKSKTPAEVYVPKERRPAVVRRFSYPDGIEVCRVSANGHFRFERVAYTLSISLAGHLIGIQRLSVTKARAWFHDIDLGTIELEPDVDDSVYADAMDWTHKRTRQGAA
jgi:hypothetical protein